MTSEITEEIVDKAIKAYREARHPKDDPGTTRDHKIGIQAALEVAFASPKQDEVVRELVETGEALFDRLTEFEHRMGDDETFRDYYGHVAPASVRFAQVLAKIGANHDK